MNHLLLIMTAVSVTLHIPSSYRTMTGVMKPDVGLCSGVLIGTNNVLTASHCVDDAKGPVMVSLPNGHSALAIVVKASPEMDLALLKMTKPVKISLPLGKSPHVTDKVFTINSGGGIAHTYGEGYVRNIRRVEGEDAYPLLMDSFLIAQGASGSGVFDGKGNLVGINVISSETGSIAVHIDTIKAFLKDIKL